MNAPDPLLLATAIEAVQKAGAIQMAHFGGPMRIDKKGDIDLVTEVDVAVERMFRAMIAERFPDHVVLGEELQQDDLVRHAAPGYCWVFDPIDGTTNFAHGLADLLRVAGPRTRWRGHRRCRLRPDAARAVHGRKGRRAPGSTASPSRDARRQRARQPAGHGLPVHRPAAGGRRRTGGACSGISSDGAAPCAAWGRPPWTSATWPLVASTASTRRPSSRGTPAAAR